MTVPGFVAEASLYKTSRCYQMAQVVAALESAGAVVPQEPAWTGHRYTTCDYGTGIMRCWDTMEDGSVRVTNCGSCVPPPNYVF